MNAYIGLDVILKCIGSNVLKQKIILSRRKYNFYYADVHFDELLHIEYTNPRSKISILENAVKTITALTDNNAVVSTPLSLAFKNQSPMAALKACVGKENAHLGMTEIVTLSNKLIQSKTADPTEDIRMIKDPTDSWPVDEILKNMHYREFIKATLPFDLFFLIETQPKAQIRNLIEINRNLRDTLFEIIFKALDIVNYHYNDPIDKNFYEARHAMYGMKTDVFMTDDEKFRKRCAVVYKYLGINTAISRLDMMNIK